MSTLTDYFSQLPIPYSGVSVNGVYLERLVVGYRTASLSGRDDFSSSITEKDVGDTAISRYVSKKDGTKDIDVKFAVTAEDRTALEKVLNALKGALQTENSKFVFNDEPDVYYVGTVSKVSADLVTSVQTDVAVASGSFTIHCTDPYKYAIIEASFTATEVNAGSLQTTIVNNGSVAVPISYTVQHKADNGYVAMISDSGILQFGSVEEVDGVQRTNSEYITTSSDYRRWSQDTKWVTDTGVNGQNNANKTAGALSTPTVDSFIVLALASKGTDTEGTWNGAMKTLTLPSPAINAYIYMNSWFETGAMGQTGCQTVAFLDANNKCICAQSIYKSDSVGNMAHVDFWVGGNTPRVFKSVDFEPCNNGSQNPFTENLGHSDMRKDGDKIAFYWFGSYPSITVPELKNSKVAKVQLYIGQYGSRSLGSTIYLTHNYFRKILIRSDVEYWKDIPNRYQNGDTLYVDGQTFKAYTNGMINTVDEIRGSAYFFAEPGETVVEYVYSSWCKTPPTITATIREAWK